MNKWIKRLGITIGALTILGLIGAIWLVSTFPGPKEINSMLKKSEPAPLADTNKPVPTPQTKSADVPSETSEQTVEAKTKKNASKKASPEEVVMNIIDSKNVLDVCANLNEKTVYSPNKKDIDFNFGDLFDPANEQNRDPYLNSGKYLVQKIFQDEKLSALMRDVVAAKGSAKNEKELDTLIDKLGFYSKAALTVAHLKSRKREFEILADRAKHLTVFVQMATLKPDLKLEGDFLENCDSLQTSILNDEEIDIKKERAELLKFMKKVNIEPAEIGFEPDTFMNFHIETAGKNLKFKLSDEKDEQT